jgi:hypothetical protein
MTLIHTVATARWLLQVSDRLVTVTRPARVERFDAQSNKTVVFHATDGIATLSYSGLAFLERAPTDAWIASKLNGVEHPFDPTGVAFSFRMGIRRTVWPKLGLALQSLAAELTKLTARKSRLKGIPVCIAVAGWHWYRRKQPRPFVAEISRTTGGEYKIDWSPRRHRYHIAHLVLPDTPFADDELAEIDNCLARVDLTAASVVLVKSIQRVAARSETVGPDCMAVSLSHPYVQSPLLRTEFVLHAGEEPAPLCRAYSPWVIGPRECFPPALMVGGASMSVRVGIYEYQRFAVNPGHTAAGGIALLLDPQARRLER